MIANLKGQHQAATFKPGNNHEKLFNTCLLSDIDGFLYSEKVQFETEIEKQITQICTEYTPTEAAQHKEYFVSQLKRLAAELYHNADTLINNAITFEKAAYDFGIKRPNVKRNHVRPLPSALPTPTPTETPTPGVDIAAVKDSVNKMCAFPFA